MAATRCEVHKRCASKVLNAHHSPPRSWAPAGVAWQGRFHVLCPNAHEGEVHAGIDERIREGRLVRQYSPKVREPIAEAFELAARYGMQPRPTL